MSSTTDGPTSGKARLALVIGATGSFGGHMTAALLNRGWRVRALSRDPRGARVRTGLNMPIDWIGGDALAAADVAAAASGASLIVHAANPPAYRNWAGTVLPMLESTIAAARAEGARILLPGTVYNFAPDAGARITEGTPQRPVTRKGKIRAAMEQRLAGEARQGVKSLVVRAGDFFGPATPNSALASLVVAMGARPRVLLRPGPRGVGHAFAYLPDMATAAAMILDQEDRLAEHDIFHFAGQFLTPTDLLDALRRAADDPRILSIAFPWPVMWAAAPFVETLREMLEMRYLWRRPVGLDNGKLTAFLGVEPRTPLDEALRATLSDMESRGTREGPAPSASCNIRPVPV